MVRGRGFAWGFVLWTLRTKLDSYYMILKRLDSHVGGNWVNLKVRILLWEAT